MGFDFGNGDLLAALQFVKTLGRRFVDAPNEFQALSQEVKRLSTVLQAIDDLDPQDALEDRQKQRLNRISRECGDALDELWRLLDQYQQVNRDDEEHCDAGTRTRTSRSLRVWRQVPCKATETREVQKRLQAVIDRFNGFLVDVNV
ncbi:uncharacterized protein BO95DRAFT_464873 [Aspergillus brunneoviolaceus CBS 621.78]|uniref:Uncharacterized protein n=1 Tax=Aspergillus brunneoviolaceus CBS 621.78 TaxID=1450534 RepID=A0ACD1G636_9EURO|nr:hypothetical protein BO95DRAFT_464873 [Aspergillus brunneoviolaceus CBS 621.78]RAH44628.1 hypothetical protein BO95DRAFT_464873 [Aspergillus brunneoviolaceus CBS 621.78]